MEDRDLNYSSCTKNSNLYGIVLYKTAQSIPGSTCNTFGPFVSCQKFLKTLETLELIGGSSESCANLAEGLATSLACFQDLEDMREKTPTQKHCILLANSSPYSMPVQECWEYEGKTYEQLAQLLMERNINLSIISPRKIPVLFKIFEKAGGDVNQSASKNLGDPRHLVLLKGFQLKEVSPSPMNNLNNQVNVGEMPVNEPQMMGQNVRPIMNQPMRPILPNQTPINQLNQQVPGPMNQQGNYGQQQQGMVPGYQQPMNRPRWGMPPQQRPFMNPGMMANNNPNMIQQQQQQQPQQQSQPSALISQLSQPPNIQLSAQQQQQYRMQLQNQQIMQQNQQSQQQNPQQMHQMQMGMQNPGQAGPQMAQMQGNPQNQQTMMQNQGMGGQQGMGQPGGPQQQQQNQQQVASQGAGQQIQGQTMQNPQQMQQGPQPGQSQPQQNPQQIPMNMGSREKIWSGILEWTEKQNKNDQNKITKQVACSVTANCANGEAEIRADNWPPRLIMQLMPKHLIGSAGGQYLKESKTVIFHPSPSPELESLSKVMANGFAGCVHFTPSFDVSIVLARKMSEIQNDPF
jgi:mediator of RNA polymerase II transcription subunit 25